MLFRFFIFQVPIGDPQKEPEKSKEGSKFFKKTKIDRRKTTGEIKSVGQSMFQFRSKKTVCLKNLYFIYMKHKISTHTNFNQQTV